MNAHLCRWKRAAVAVVLGSVLSWGAPLMGQDTGLDPEVQRLANEIIGQVITRLEAEQSRREELQNLASAHRYANPYGVEVIEYFYQDNSRRSAVYAFGLTLVPINDPTFESQKGYFKQEYPFLKVKFAGYLQKHPLRQHLDIEPLVKELDQKLADYQQSFLPLQLELRTLKDTYKVREDIYFDVELKNVSNNHMSVRGLGEKTLFFLYNESYWGTRPWDNERGGEPLILKAGESLKLRFKGEGFSGATDVEVFAVYGMSVDGVNPSGVLKIRVSR